VGKAESHAGSGAGTGRAEMRVVATTIARGRDLKIYIFAEIV
jgi:hypothetical protein